MLDAMLRKVRMPNAMLRTVVFDADAMPDLNFPYDLLYASIVSYRTT